jgi:hypothetical protein
MHCQEVARRASGPGGGGLSAPAGRVEPSSASLMRVADRVMLDRHRLEGSHRCIYKQSKTNCLLMLCC